MEKTEAWAERKIEIQMEQLPDVDTLVDELGDKLLEYGDSENKKPIAVGDRVLVTYNGYSENKKYDGKYGTVADDTSIIADSSIIIVDFENAGRFQKSKSIYCHKDEVSLPRAQS